jgi:hypothetical protein
MPEVTLREAERSEAATDLRIKFASINQRGNLEPDSHEEYTQFLAELPDGWRAEHLGRIETRTEADRDAWHLTNGEIDLLAVAHETGLELVAVGAIANVVSGAILAIATWGWKRWHKLRENSARLKVASSFVIEVPRTDRTLPPIRLVIPPPVTDEELGRYLRVAAESSQAG